ncbi:hypothetical protein BFINE_47740 [Bacteroides finegoldii DSM 17565]|nr:hypothetical protein BFINE_47740 [Bacteroides finegoldii DSM 17565]
MGDYKNLSPAQIEDLRYVQDVKGTRVTYTIFAHKIPDEFMSGENHEIATSEGIEEYAKALVDTMYKYGYQGIDLDYEPGYQEFREFRSMVLWLDLHICGLTIWTIWKFL